MRKSGTRLGQSQSYLIRYFGSLLIIVLFFNHSIGYASTDWELEETLNKLFSEAGYVEVLEQFHQDEENLKESNLAMYHYLNGVKHIHGHNFLIAQINFENALEISIEENQLDMEIATLKQLIFLSEFYHDLGSLLDYGTRLLELAKEMNDPMSEMYAHKVISTVLIFTVNTEEALNHLERMLSLAHQHEDVLFEGVYNTMMGHITFSHFELDSALAYYEQAADLYGTIEQGGIRSSDPLLNDVMLMLVKAQLYKEDVNILLDEMDTLAQEMKSSYFQPLILSHLYSFKGQIQLQYGLNKGAIESLEKSKGHIENIVHMETKNDPLTWPLLLLAGAYYGDEDYRQAADMYMRVAVNTAMNPDFLRDMDDVSSRLREYLERDLNDQILLLTDLHDTQRRALVQQRVMLGFVIISLFVIGRAFVLKRKEHKKVSELKNELYVQSITDSLTGVYNRKRIFEVLHAQEQECVVALIDIDNFKIVNDTHGYIAGDKVLKTIVNTIKSSIRETDDIGRFGGEEFLIILKNTDFDAAVPIIERVRKNVEALEWEYEGLKTTLSIGVSTISDLNAEEVFGRVDELVHEAKRTGKNKVVCNPEEATI
ncbi:MULTISPECIES: GGDEF domain-containing protein [Bacillaceae]|uniref:GGDEF domain-containing protein n=1 Tax=Evansella alkalicola TaxID=745819 RepID=A0ABS6JW52_9BACI|nr:MULTISPECIES: GGDEF domain-containing protein [Bacillaceae]MBU9722814.1 GGDEF domain-containing protein [Bacillus alkalicola]